MAARCSPWRGLCRARLHPAHAGARSSRALQRCLDTRGPLRRLRVADLGTDFYPRLVGAASDDVQCNRLVNEQAHISLLLALPGVLATLTFPHSSSGCSTAPRSRARSRSCVGSASAWRCACSPGLSATSSSRRTGRRCSSRSTWPGAWRTLACPGGYRPAGRRRCGHRLLRLLRLPCGDGLPGGATPQRLPLEPGHRASRRCGNAGRGRGVPRAALAAAGGRNGVRPVADAGQCLCIGPPIA